MCGGNDLEQEEEEGARHNASWLMIFAEILQIVSCVFVKCHKCT